MSSQLLFHAVNQGDLGLCQCLVVEGCADVNYQNTMGETCVHAAAMRGLPAVMELLLASGADPNLARAREYGGGTPLHVATEKNFIRVAEVLLESGADPNIPDALGMLPLHLAARAGNDEMALLLLTHGTRPDAPDNMGKPPAYYAEYFEYDYLQRMLPPSTYSWKEQRKAEMSRLHFIEAEEEPKPEKKAKKKK